MPRAWSACCQVSSPSSVSIPSCPACSPVNSWPSALPGSPALAGSTAVPVSTSKTYLRLASAPCLGLALSVPELCLVGVPALLLSAAMLCRGRGGGAVLGLPTHSSSPLLDPCAPVARVMGGFHPRPRLSLRGFRPPRGNSATPGVSVPCGDSTPCPLPGGAPMGFPPLRRSHRPPHFPPLQGTRGPLRRPRGPHRGPALPRIFRPSFTAGLRTSPCSPASPHGGPALPPCWRPRRRISCCFPLRPLRPQVALPCHCPASPTSSPSASLFLPPPPLRSSPIAEYS